MGNGDFQIQLDKSEWTPGERIKGSLVVTLAHDLPVSHIVLKFKGKIHASVKVFERPKRDNATNCNYSDSDSDSSTETTRFGGDRFNCECSKRKKKTHKHKRNEHGCNFKAEVSKSDTIELIHFITTIDADPELGSRILKRGVSLIPFEFEPSGDLSSCIPSGIVKSNGSIVVSYAVEASIHYPLSYYTSSFTTLDIFNHIKLWWTASVQVQVLANQSTLPSHPVVKKVPFQVGYWEQSSLSLDQKLKYAFGGDTAIDWYDMLLEVKTPSLLQLTDNSGELLSNFMKLKIVPREGSESKLPPEMEVNGLKVEHITSALFKPKPNTLTENEKLSIECGEKKVWEIENKWVLADLKNIGFWIDPENLNSLKSLLRTIEFPTSNMLSTCATSDLHVNHYLLVTLKVKVRDDESDGTKQAAQTVKFKTPIHIEKVNPEEKLILVD